MRKIANACSADQRLGEPTEVLELADVPEPLGPAAGEVLVGVEYAPFNMNDPIPDSGRISSSTFAVQRRRQ
jgi:NADPH:quinone reductase-like Zn-dependent oxidoreductase